MFNNPFDSFHKTVGKAKKEREQLDRLLTISTPGELALVAVTAGILLLFLAWLFFGSVARSVTVDGVLLATGEQTLEGSPPLQAAIWLERDVARQISSGMPALLNVALPDGDAHSIEVKVTAIAQVPLSGGLAPIESAAPVSMHIVHIALDEGPSFAFPDGQHCRIVVELGSQSPFAFFVRRRS